MRVNNGYLTAGGTGPGELIIHANQAMTIGANMVDNGSESVRLTVGGYSDSERTVVLSGANSYSGETVINDGVRLHIISPQAVPADNDLIVNGGEYHVILPVADVIGLGSLTLQQGGVINRNGTDSGINADSYLLEDGVIAVELHGIGPAIKFTEGIVHLSAGEDNSAYSGSIQIDEGILSVEDRRSLGTGTVVVNPFGRLVLNTAVVEGNVVLMGGELSAVRTSSIEPDFVGNLTVASNSTIFLVSGLSKDGSGSGEFRISGAIDGDADLTVTGFQFGNGLTLAGNNSQYSGDIVVESGGLEVHGPMSLGTGQTIIQADAQIDVLTDVQAGSILLDGGRLRSLQIERSINVPLHFSDRSELEHVFTLRLNGGSEFMDDSRVIKVREGATVISDVTQVSGEGTLEILEGGVVFGGTITPTVPDARLSVLGASLMDFQASIDLGNGGDLGLMFDGQIADIAIDATGQSLSGSGVLSANLALENGGTISPGSSVGAMTINGAATIADGQYQWEIMDALGVPGSGWDWADIAETLTLAATLDDPFVLSIVGLGANDQPGSVVNFDNEDDYEWLMLSASDIVGFNPAAI